MAAAARFQMGKGKGWAGEEAAAAAARRLGVRTCAHWNVVPAAVGRAARAQDRRRLLEVLCSRARAADAVSAFPAAGGSSQ